MRKFDITYLFIFMPSNPYSISNKKIDINKFKKGNPQLIISLYPTRKAISLT